MSNLMESSGAMRSGHVVCVLVHPSARGTPGVLPPGNQAVKTDSGSHRAVMVAARRAKEMKRRLGRCPGMRRAGRDGSGGVRTAQQDGARVLAEGPPGQAHGGNRRETEKRKQGHLGLPRAFGSRMLLSKEWECVSSELSGSSYHRSHGRKNLPEDGALSRLSQSRPGHLTTSQILKSAPRGMVSCQPALTRSRERRGATGSVGEPQGVLGSHRERWGARNSTAFPAAHSQRPQNWNRSGFTQERALFPARHRLGI